MMTLQDMSDRLEIQDLLTRYCGCIDGRNWEGLDDIFTSDAFIDYTAVGGQKGTLPEIKAYLSVALKPFEGFQHMLGLPDMQIDGDTANVRTICFNPMTINMEGEQKVFFVGVWYVDEMLRTAQGWRIKTRREELSYFHNFPEGFAPVQS